MDAPSVDRLKMKEIAGDITRAMGEIDSQMTEDERKSLITKVAAHCRSHGNETLRDAIIETFQEIRAAQDTTPGSAY